MFNKNDLKTDNLFMILNKHLQVNNFATNINSWLDMPFKINPT